MILKKNATDFTNHTDFYPVDRSPGAHFVHFVLLTRESLLSSQKILGGTLAELAPWRLKLDNQRQPLRSEGREGNAKGRSAGRFAAVATPFSPWDSFVNSRFLTKFLAEISRPSYHLL